MKIEGDIRLKTIIHTLKHGYRALSQMKWFSASGFHISVAGLLGVTGFVWAAKDGKLGSLSTLPWIPEKENRLENIVLVPGLQNLGNNCFLNVILQALASCLNFQPFLQGVIENFESSEVEELAESLPLTVALAALLEELCVVDEETIVLSPRKVMLALGLYIGNFNLTGQQDAAEAFLHLLSSLREESSDCYLPNQSSLADIYTSPNFRVLSPKTKEDQNGEDRWQRHFLGPFDGILASSLTCQTCSSQISLDFQFFHNLPLSPVLDSSSSIMVGCKLEDCLRQFIVAENIESYHCSNCWHIAAVKYLTLLGVSETVIEKLRKCNWHDSCNCRSRFQLERLPWSSNLSLTLKQLSIARCPKILCIHLQRAMVNPFGELVKLQGHIAFSLILDLFPFMTSGVEIKNYKAIDQNGSEKRRCQIPVAPSNHVNLQCNRRKLNCLGEHRGEITFYKVEADEFGGDDHVENFPAESSVPRTVGFSEATRSDSDFQSDEKLSTTRQLVPSLSKLYRLVSVVEHFGRPGSGHYTVYRSVRVESSKKVPLEKLERAQYCWFCISDAEVYCVSEKDVLSAEASLLFYERIVEL